MADEREDTKADETDGQAPAKKKRKVTKSEYLLERERRSIQLADGTDVEIKGPLWDQVTKSGYETTAKAMTALRKLVAGSQSGHKDGDVYRVVRVTKGNIKPKIEKVAKVTL